MEGGHRHGRPYYRCAPRGNNRGRPDKYGGHDKTVFIREDQLLDGVARFFAERVLGENRHSMLIKQIATIDDTAARARQTEREKLQRTLADVVRRQDTILRQAQDGDLDDPFTKGLRGRYNQLEEQKAAALAAIATLDAADQSEPARRPTADEVGLLDQLPFVQSNLAQAPTNPLRRLLEATHLTLRLGDDDRVGVTITLPADTIPKVAAAARAIGEEVSGNADAAGTSPRSFVGMQSEPHRGYH